MIEEPQAGIDDLEDVSPHCRQVRYISIETTTEEAQTIKEILSVYRDRGEDDAKHLLHVSNFTRKLRFALGGM